MPQTSYNIIQGGTMFVLQANGLTANNNNTIRMVCKTSGGAITIKLPKISSVQNWNTVLLIDDTDDMAGTNNITIECAVGDTIENAPTHVINTNGGKVQLLISSQNEYSVYTDGSGGVSGVDAYGVFSTASNTDIKSASNLAVPLTSSGSTLGLSHVNLPPSNTITINHAGIYRIDIDAEVMSSLTLTGGA